MDSIPPELIDTIFGHVDDPESFVSCSCVATIFVAPSQRNIFRLMRAEADIQGPRNLLAREAFIAESPHIASYVHDLELQIPYLEEEERALASILRSLPNLERLVVSGRTLHWRGISEGLKGALMEVIDRPALQRVHLIGLMHTPSAFILRLVSSVSIFLCYTSIDPPTDSGTTPDIGSLVSETRLRHLIVPGPSAGVPFLCDVLLHTPSCIAHLERLQVATHPSGNAHIARLLYAVSHTLRHLELDPKGPLLQSLSLPPMPRVHTLTVHLYIDHHQNFVRQFPLSALTNIASALPQLEVLILNVIVEIAPEDHESAWPSRTQPVLDDVHMPHLRLVECRLRPRRNMSDKDIVIRKLRAAVEELIPGLRGTHRLKCDFTGYLFFGNLLP
ncbi:hypothetical protein C8J57DRAFT_1276030 [Mycena rebaudengoi]|nr:hypothetical protein C8J57DRAFT_1276030 [Mycena rebaudengoi]